MLRIFIKHVSQTMLMHFLLWQTSE